MGDGMAGRVFQALVAPIVLIVAVLGSILSGVATPTEAAGVGAIGATLLAGHRLLPDRPIPIYLAAIGLIGVIALTTALDLRVGRTDVASIEQIGMAVAAILLVFVAIGLLAALGRAHADGTLLEVMQSTAKISAMVFIIVIGAQLFSLVFRGFGGDEMVHEFLTNMPGGALGAMILVMAVLFVLGFFLDFIEITFVVVPIVGPILLQLDLDPIWLGVMIAVNLQTSFLTPPFGFALFYLRGVAPPEVTTLHIYRGVIPFICIQLLMLALLALFPAMATWLPTVIFG
jgi:TRAP-type mannitol/chloroaromatic compound transport system permease large subunit